jgi:predicted TPR repeat methyltransferase
MTPNAPGRRPRNRWLADTGGTRGPEYAARFDALEASGADVHGEAAFVDALLRGGSKVVDAGCGTGRVGRELARRGHHVVGIDLDASMLAVAKQRSPELTWLEADLLEVTGADVGAPVDCVVMAGNVAVYLTPGTERDVVAAVASWLAPGGLLVAGFATDRDVSPADYRAFCAEAGLVEASAHAGWDGAPAGDGDDWVVLVHRR